MKKTSKKHFEIFKAECLKWIDIFGLKGYEFHYEHKAVGDGNVAECHRNSTSRTARLSLCKVWPERSMVPLNDDNIKTLAFEEVCHVFLYSLSSCAYARHIMDHEIGEAEHGIIKILQNILYPKY
ncbi:MAG: hypothetical protein H8E17_12600 [Deltaproteobacteria bacterium]|nr:hypothetical protein [Deltaproteobacteria bacterium]